MALIEMEIYQDNSEKATVTDGEGAWMFTDTLIDVKNHR